MREELPRGTCPDHSMTVPKEVALRYGYQDSTQEQAARAAGKGFAYENNKGDMQQLRCRTDD